jgi:hypothetical protein
MAADEPFLRNSDFKVQQYGFYLGGPIIKDKLHFFIAPEWQSRSQPAVGPYEGGPTTESGNISPDTLRRIANAIDPLFAIGSTGLVSTGNPLTNLSGRLDWQVNAGNRLVFRQLYNTAEQDNFSRNNRTFNAAVGNQNSGFRYTSNMFTTQDDNISSVLQLFSQFSKGSSNEFLVGYNKIKDERVIPVASPEVSVQVTNLQGGTTAAATRHRGFRRGTCSGRTSSRWRTINMPIGAHTLTLGVRRARTSNNFAQRLRRVCLPEHHDTPGEDAAQLLFGPATAGRSRPTSTSAVQPVPQDLEHPANRPTGGLRRRSPQYRTTRCNDKIAAASRRLTRCGQHEREAEDTRLVAASLLQLGSRRQQESVPRDDRLPRARPRIPSATPTRTRASAWSR